MTSGSSPLLFIVRKIRTFSLTNSCHSHPFAWYAFLCASLAGWANYAQYKRLAPMFPDYNVYSKEEGGRMMSAKRQELADVMRYNRMVSNMRDDLSQK